MYEDPYKDSQIDHDLEYYTGDLVAIIRIRLGRDEQVPCPCCGSDLSGEVKAGEHRPHDSPSGWYWECGTYLVTEDAQHREHLRRTDDCKLYEKMVLTAMARKLLDYKMPPIEDPDL